MNVFQQERRKGATFGCVTLQPMIPPAEASYQRRVEQVLTEENCFKVKMVSSVPFQFAWNVVQ